MFQTADASFPTLCINHNVNRFVNLMAGEMVVILHPNRASPDVLSVTVLYTAVV